MKYKPLIMALPIITLLAGCSSAPQAPIATATTAPTQTTQIELESTCQQISLEPTPDAKIASLFPPVTDEDNVMGPKDAAMTIIEYGDFQ